MWNNGCSVKENMKQENCKGEMDEDERQESQCEGAEEGFH